MEFKFVTSYLAPPVCAVYVLGIFVPRVNEAGAFWGLLMGLVVGLARFFTEVAYGSVECYEPDTRPFLLTKVHYLYFGIILFILSCVVTIVVSLLTEPVNEKHLYRLTYWTRNSEDDRISLADEERIRKKKKIEVHTVDGSKTNDVPTQPTEPKAKFSRNEDLPKWRRIVNTFLGLDSEHQPELSEAEKQQMQKKMISLHEKPFWKTFWDVNAILILTVAVFFWAFYA